MEKDKELFQVNVTFGNFKSHQEASDYANFVKYLLNTKIIPSSVEVKSSWK
jgi:hypothetical protein